MKKVALILGILAIFAFSAAAEARDAADTFRHSCSHCHGLKGEGIRGLTATLKGSELVTKGSDADIRTVIKEGRIGTGKKFKDYPVIMYPVKDLADDEIVALIKYLRTEIQK